MSTLQFFWNPNCFLKKPELQFAKSLNRYDYRTLQILLLILIGLNYPNNGILGNFLFNNIRRPVRHFRDYGIFQN